MLQQFLNYRPNQILICVILIAIIFFLFIMPKIEHYDNVDNMAFKNDLSNALNKDIAKIDTNKCSKSCCVYTQWQLPPELQQTGLSAEESQKYIPSNFSCNFGSNSGSGCVCYTKEDSEYLTNKGGNI
jgi:hypothetical protein